MRFGWLGVVIGLTMAEMMTAAANPQTEITNGQIAMKVYLPDAKDGYYRGTRFDWSGVVYSLRAHGHEYYGPWFDKTDTKVHDFVYDGDHIVAGPCSAITGPVDEFQEMGWDEAKAGGHFVKIGVGVLRKPEDGKYDNYRLYDIIDGGKRTFQHTADSLEFTQELKDGESGYGYSYKKTLRLVPGKAQMVLEHSLTNTGSRAIHSNVFNHNFLVLDGQGPGPDVSISVPFNIHSNHPPNAELAAIRGKEIVYLKKLEGHDTVATPLEGFGGSAKDNEIRVENSRLRVGMKIVADRPLLKESLWSIRSVLAMEPFVAIDVDPGQTFTWTSTYDYYALSGTIQ